MNLDVTPATRHAARAAVLLVLGTAGYLAWSYAALPELLPVHFGWNGAPNGWQYKTLARVMMPVYVQLALLLSFGGVAALLVSRRRPAPGPAAPDVKAARSAAEAVLLMAVIWVTFQGYAAVALVRMWSTRLPTLGAGYTWLEIAGLLLTGVVGVRAQAQLGRPAPLPYVAAHWRLGQLYCNAEDPALFVPTRDGSRWTLNFGRPAAVFLLGGVLVAGVAIPTIILALALRG